MSPENSPNLQRKARPAPMNLIAGDPTITLLIGFIVLAVVVFGILSPGSFLSMDTVKSMAFQMPELGILSLAMMVPLMSGGLNLAIIATANLAGLVIAAVVTNLIQPSSPPLAVTGVIALAIVAGSITALAIGLATGIIVAFLRVHPILVTLGMMTLVKGIAIVTTRGTVIGGFPPGSCLSETARYLGYRRR